MPKKQPLYPHVTKGQNKENRQSYILTGRGKAEAATISESDTYIPLVLSKAYLYYGEGGEIDFERIRKELGIAILTLNQVIEQMVKEGYIGKPTWFDRR